MPSREGSLSMSTKPGTIHVLGGARKRSRGVLDVLEAHGYSLAWPRFAEAFVGWGRRESGEQAARKASRAARPVIRLEDAFVRSVGLGVRGAPPLGLIADPRGVYYDARNPSLIEDRLASAWRLDGEGRTSAQNALALFHELRLSKYNPPRRQTARVDGPYTLVLDQTAGDESISHGRADGASFDTMLRAALDGGPGQVVVRLHPDVLTGRKKGHLAPDDIEALGIASDRIVHDAQGDLRDLIEGADAVHAVTSLAGFEARLMGRPTIVHGLPFYAGWGERGDEQGSDRRAATRTPLEIFAAAYLDLPLYFDPFEGVPCTFERVAQIIADEREEAERRAVRTHGFGITRWKRDFVRLHLGHASPGTFGSGHVTFHRSAASALDAAGPDERLACWASRLSDDDADRIEEAGRTLTRIEDGFLRSRGRGAAFTFPGSLAIDARGIYYDPSMPSELETTIERGGFDEAVLERARSLIAAMTAGGFTKYNLDDGAPVPEIAAGRRAILVVGQVEDDASILAGATGAVRTNRELLEAARSEHPGAELIYRPHPDVERGRRKGRVPASDLAALADHVATRAPLPELLSLAERVHAITSLAGLEALMRGTPVTCHGMPFYAGWGLTDDRAACERRTRRATLEEVVAAAYVLHPSMVDPTTRRFCTPERLMQRIAGTPPTEWSVPVMLARRLLGL